MTQIADTAHGPVEYDVIGDGPPVLVVHGSPGGIDQAVAMAGFLGPAGCKAIVASRPGYLGTPLEGRETIDAQADLHAALLDHLGIARVGVLGWSGGGPSAYRLAVLHPERVGAIVVLAGVSKSLARAKEDMASRLMFHTRTGEFLMRTMIAHAPESLISSTLAAEGDLTKEQVKQRTEEVFTDPVKRQFVLDLDASVSERGPRKAGVDNDYEQFEAIESLELERVAVPALLVQGSVDTDVTPDHSEHAAATIPGAELLLLEGGTHLAFYTHPESAAAQARALELLRS